MLKALLLILVALTISSQLGTMNYDGLMVGYSDFKYLPFLSNGSLEFQPGEGLWVKTVGRDTTLILRSPDGLHEVHMLRPGESKLLKTFSGESDVGDWVLEIADGESMILIVRDPDDEPLTISYSISGSNLVARLRGSPSAIFMDTNKGERFILIAGWSNRLNADLLFGGDFEGDLPAEIIIDVLLKEDLIYEGYLEGIPYRGRFEPIVARVKAQMINGSYHVHLPEIHEVGANGIMPLRLGEAILRLWLNESYSLMRPVYILDRRFRELAGTNADRVVTIPLSNILNQSLRILRADDRGLEFIDLNPPVALVRILGSRATPLTNISMMASSPVAVINGTAYILLSESEDVPAYPRSSVRTSIKIYVNGFLAESRDVNLLRGGIYNLSLNLKRLTLEIIPPDKEVLKKVHLMINGTSFKHENGTASYLLPLGTYLIRAAAPGFEASVRLTLSEDSSIKLKLERVLRVGDVLKALAVIEAACVILLAYANYKGIAPRVGMRIHRGPKARENNINIIENRFLRKMLFIRLSKLIILMKTPLVNYSRKL